MQILRINADHHGLATQSGEAVAPALRRFLHGADQPASVTIMVHGFRYAPGAAHHDPHNLIYSPSPDPARPRVLSWPHHLTKSSRTRLIAFGWPARGSIWTAKHQSQIAGRALAALICQLRAHKVSVNLFAHSLGARTALSAIGELPERSVARAVLMVPAATRSEARTALTSSAGRTCRVLNVATRENLAFDLAFLSATAHMDAPVAQGLGGAPENWTDLYIDREDTRSALAQQGFRIAAPVTRVCHWSPYLRPGLFAVYRAFLSDRLSLAALATPVERKRFLSLPTLGPAA